MTYNSLCATHREPRGELAGNAGPDCGVRFSGMAPDARGSPRQNQPLLTGLDQNTVLFGTRDGALLQPTADSRFVARILIVEVALEKPFFPWDHNRRDEADGGNERYQQPKVI